MTEPNLLSPLLLCAAELFANHNSQIGFDASQALEAASSMPLETQAETVSQCKTLDVAFRQHSSPMIEHVRTLENHLHWKDTSSVMKPDNIQQYLAFTELLGPSGMTINHNCRVGLLFQTKNALYPNHKHAAEELYYVVSGTGFWSQSNSELTAKPPGEFIHHASWEPHATKTIDEPLLTIWCWTGDIRYDSYEML